MARSVVIESGPLLAEEDLEGLLLGLQKVFAN